MMESFIFVISCCLIATFFYISAQLEANRKELEFLRHETEKNGAILQHVLVSKTRPDLSDSPIFNLETEEREAGTSSLGEMLSTAKERAKAEHRY